MRTLAKAELAAAIVSFAMIFVAGLAVRLGALIIGMTPKTVDALTKAAILVCFVVFGFACIGLMLQVFVALQVRIGNGAAPMVRFLSDHVAGVTFAMWGFLGLGTLIAIPFALGDLGFEMPLGKSRGVLTADIGMTLDEVRARSTLAFKEPRAMGDGSRMGVEQVVFEYRIANSQLRFPESRFYWLETGKGGDPHVVVLNIGVTPRKLAKPQLEAFQHGIQAQLLADGWMPGHWVAKSEETVHMWGGKRTAGDGRYWAKGNTVLIFETSRVDEEKRDEPAGAGEFVLDVFLRPRASERDLVYEPSAWTP